MILSLVVLAAVIFTDISAEESNVLMAIVGSFALANGVEHFSQKGS